MKTETKKQTTKCPFCNYRNAFIPALINHIKGNHKEEWEKSGGTWAGTLLNANKKPDTKGIVSINAPKRTPKTPKAELLQKRLYNARMRAKYVALGLTTTGKKRKRPLRPDIAKKYQNNGRSVAVVPETQVLPVDFTGDAARAILIAAEIIKDVSTGIKLRGMRR